jgi:hypothetical protein
LGSGKSGAGGLFTWVKCSHAGACVVVRCSNIGFTEDKLELVHNIIWRVNDVPATLLQPGMCEREWKCPSGHACASGSESMVRAGLPCMVLWSLLGLQEPSVLA